MVRLYYVMCCANDDVLTTLSSMFIPIHTWSKTGENSIVWKITKDENGDLSREIIHPRSTYVPLRGPLEDSEEEMNRPGYGMCD